AELTHGRAEGGLPHHHQPDLGLRLALAGAGGRVERECLVRGVATGDRVAVRQTRVRRGSGRGRRRRLTIDGAAAVAEAGEVALTLSIGALVDASAVGPCDDGLVPGLVDLLVAVDRESPDVLAAGEADVRDGADDAVQRRDRTRARDRERDRRKRRREGLLLGLLLRLCLGRGDAVLVRLHAHVHRRLEILADGRRLSTTATGSGGEERGHVRLSSNEDEELDRILAARAPTQLDPLGDVRAGRDLLGTWSGDDRVLVRNARGRIPFDPLEPVTGRRSPGRRCGGTGRGRVPARRSGCLGTWSGTVLDPAAESGASPLAAQERSTRRAIVGDLAGGANGVGPDH